LTYDIDFYSLSVTTVMTPSQYGGDSLWRPHYRPHSLWYCGL